jgi:hypothetical protein
VVEPLRTPSPLKKRRENVRVRVPLTVRANAWQFFEEAEDGWTSVPYHIVVLQSANEIKVSTCMVVRQAFFRPVKVLPSHVISRGGRLIDLCPWKTCSSTLCKYFPAHPEIGSRLRPAVCPLLDAAPGPSVSSRMAPSIIVAIEPAP